MINGLNYNGFEQLNGLHLLYADEIQIDKIDQKEINTLDNINTTTTIQQQLNNLNDYISSVDLNNIEFNVSYDYLLNTYDNDIKTWSSNQFYTKSEINTKNTTLSGYITTNYETLSSYIKTNYESLKFYVDATFYTITLTRSLFYTKLYIDDNFTRITSFDTYKQYILLTYYSQSHINNNYYTQSYINSNFYNKSTIDSYNISNNNNTLIYINNNFYSKLYIDSLISNISSNFYSKLYVDSEFQMITSKFAEIPINYYSKVYIDKELQSITLKFSEIPTNYYNKTYIDSLGSTSISSYVYANYYNKTYIDNQYTTISNYIIDNKLLIDSISGDLYTKYYDASYIDLEIYKTLADRIDTYHYTKNDINYKFITISDYILSNYNTLSGFISSNKLDVTAINNAKDAAITAKDGANTAKDGANTAASSANSAASSANGAASSANSAASAANSASSSANAAAGAATGAAAAATAAAGVASGAAATATTAAATATGAAATANGAAANANTATADANLATSNARSANDNANSAAVEARQAAEDAKKVNSYFTKTGTVLSLVNNSLQVLDAFNFPLVNLSNSSFTSSYFDTDVLFKKNITLSGSLTQNGSYMDYYTNGNSHRFYNITAEIVTKQLCEMNENYFRHNGNYALMACQDNSNKRVRLRTDVPNYSSVEFLSNQSGVQFRDAGIDCLAPATDGYQDAGSLLISAATVSIGSTPNGKTLNIALNAPYVTIGNSVSSEVYINGTLYYNGERIFANNRYSNATEFNGYITQI